MFVVKHKTVVSHVEQLIVGPGVWLLLRHATWVVRKRARRRGMRDAVFVTMYLFWLCA